MGMKKIGFMLTGASFLACGISAKLGTPELDANFSSEEMLVADNLKYEVLFSGGKDIVTTHDKQETVSKDWQDFTGFIPIHGRSDYGYIIVNHEKIQKDPVLGDGGGMTVFTVKFDKREKKWMVQDDPRGKYRNVDFSEVGFTLANCGGAQTPWGTVLTAEEWLQPNNAAIYADGNGISDTSDYMIKKFNGKKVNQSIPKYQNYNWMVEVDPKHAKAVRKQYNMGRFGHEGGFVMEDEKTVYLTDDNTPGYFFKFVAEKRRKLDKGQLYAYQQSEDGESGTWLKMPMDLNSMIEARSVAASLGATMFNRGEWIEGVNGILYWTETGRDNTGSRFDDGIAEGATLAKHLREMAHEVNGNQYEVEDPYGRILAFNPSNNKLWVHLEAGAASSDPDKHLSNPDGLASMKMGHKNYLVINEDLNGTSLGRVPPEAESFGRVNEIYVLDLSISNPTVDDLRRIVIGPKGSETTGGRFTPDGRTYFVNMQHVDTENPAPFNHDVTVAITGYADHKDFFHYKPKYSKKRKFDIDRFGGYLHFEETGNYKIYNMHGKKLLAKSNCKKMDISLLKKGSYYIKDSHGAVGKFTLR